MKMKWTSPIARLPGVALWVAAAALTGGGRAGVVVARDGCATGLHIIAARGTNEPAGLGVIGFVANAVAAAVPGTTVAGLEYPATFRDYPDSEGEGAAALRKAIDQYVANCSAARIALLGYSQVSLLESHGRRPSLRLLAGCGGGCVEALADQGWMDAGSSVDSRLPLWRTRRLLQHASARCCVVCE